MVEAQMKCWRCPEPLRVNLEVAYPGWQIKHRNWTTYVSSRVAVQCAGSPEPIIRKWLEARHHQEALTICTTITTLYRRFY